MKSPAFVAEASVANVVSAANEVSEAIAATVELPGHLARLVA